MSSPATTSASVASTPKDNTPTIKTLLSEEAADTEKTKKLKRLQKVPESCFFPLLNGVGKLGLGS